MLVFVARRLAWAVLLGFVITLLTFVLFFVLPGDSRNAQRNEQGFEPGLQTQFNTRGSLPVQYMRFLDRIVLHGDLGNSMRSRESVTTVIGRTLPVTASLVIGGVIFWLMLAFPIGCSRRCGRGRCSTKG